MPLTESEKKELLCLSRSASLRKDLRLLTDTRHNPVTAEGGEVDMDRLLAFLTQFNRILGHKIKTFRPMKDGCMKM